MTGNSVGFRMKQTRASVTLRPVDGGHMVVGRVRVVVPKGRGLDAVARVLNDDANSPVTAMVRGDDLRLTAKQPGEGGNEVSVAVSWSDAPVRLTGGKTVFAAHTVLVTDGATQTEDIGEFNTLPEAIAKARSEFAKMVARENRPIMELPRHDYREVGGERVCADCGREKSHHKSQNETA